MRIKIAAGSGEPRWISTLPSDIQDQEGEYHWNEKWEVTLLLYCPGKVAASHSGHGHCLMWLLVPSPSISQDCHSNPSAMTQVRTLIHLLYKCKTGDAGNDQVYTVSQPYLLVQINSRTEKSELLGLFSWIPHQRLQWGCLHFCIQLPLESDPSQIISSFQMRDQDNNSVLDWSMETSYFFVWWGVGVI